MPLNNLGCVIRVGGDLWRCAQPDADGFITLNKLNVGTIIKLNDNSEYPDRDEESKFYLGDVILDPYPRLFVIPPKNKVIATVHKIMELLKDGQSVAVHCTHGVDRTGLVIGAFRILHQKWSLERVQAERYLFGASAWRDIPDHLIVEFLKKLSIEYSR
jgi:hypothetical protein